VRHIRLSLPVITPERLQILRADDPVAYASFARAKNNRLKLGTIRLPYLVRIFSEQDHLLYRARERVVETHMVVRSFLLKVANHILATVPL